MKILRAVIDVAVAEAIIEHPKYFTPRGVEHARNAIVQKIMKALRDGDKTEPDSAPIIEPPRFQLVPITSREGRAYCWLRELAGAVPPTPIGDNYALPPCANIPAVMALADIADDAPRYFITDKKQRAAWHNFFEETLPSIGRRSRVQVFLGEDGVWFPSLWPPSKEGKIYEPEDHEAA